jgi:hypothetical protein
VKITMASGQRAAASVQPDFWLCGWWLGACEPKAVEAGMQMSKQSRGNEMKC